MHPRGIVLAENVRTEILLADPLHQQDRRSIERHTARAETVIPEFGRLLDLCIREHLPACIMRVVDNFDVHVLTDDSATDRRRDPPAAGCRVEARLLVLLGAQLDGWPARRIPFRLDQQPRPEVVTRRERLIETRAKKLEPWSARPRPRWIEHTHR